jgi:hypothetical protein
LLHAAIVENKWISFVEFPLHLGNRLG